MKSLHALTLAAERTVALLIEEYADQKKLLLDEVLFGGTNGGFEFWLGALMGLLNSDHPYSKKPHLEKLHECLDLYRDFL